MIAKGSCEEAHASDSVKELLVQAQGVDDDEWEQAYKGETEVVLTGQVGTSARSFALSNSWKEFDETVFKLVKDKRQAWLNGNADYVVLVVPH